MIGKRDPAPTAQKRVKQAHADAFLSNQTDSIKHPLCSCGSCSLAQPGADQSLAQAQTESRKLSYGTQVVLR